jgi:hypothetical protein
MKATKTLPPYYRKSGALDLTRSGLAFLGANALGLVLAVLFGGLGLLLLVSRPDAGDILHIVATPALALVVAPVALIVAGLLLHEAIHGAFFWLFTRERPVFGIKLLYLYAAAPDWYLPRNQHLIVGMAPFALITFGGFALLPIVPVAWALGVLLVAVMNAAGGAGDVLVLAWLLAKPRETLVRDTGDTFTIYNPA